MPRRTPAEPEPAPDAEPDAAARIREAALELFATRGFHGTGIRQLAERAGLSSATLYHYMGTKEDLLVALMTGGLDRLIALAEAVEAEEPDPLRRLAALVRLHVREHAERPRETRVVDDQIGVLDGAARDAVVALRDRYEDVWRRALDPLVGDPSVALADAAAAALARRALLEMCTGVAHWYRADGALGLEALGEAHAAMALRLVGATSPR